MAGPVRGESPGRHPDGLLCPRRLHQQHRFHHPERPTRRKSFHLQYPPLPRRSRLVHSQITDPL